MRAALLAGAALWAAAPPAWAEQQVAVWRFEHSGFGRVVFDIPPPISFQVEERGNQVVVTFAGNPIVRKPESVPHNVVSVVTGKGTATITVVPGARVARSQAEKRLFIDVFDPAAEGRDGAAAEPGAMPGQRPGAEPAAGAAAAEPSPAGPGSGGRGGAEQPASAPGQGADPAPVLSAGTPGATEEAAADPGPLQVLAGPEVGAAAFRRGDLGVVVFDERVILEPQIGKRDDRLANAALETLNRGAMLTVPLGPGESLSLRHERGAWAVTVAPADGSAAEQAAVPDGIAFRFANPGRVMAVRDKLTGESLLLGTVKQGGGERTSVQDGRAGPGYAVLPTWLGLALEPTSDRVDLRASAAGFTLLSPDSAAPARTAAAPSENPFGIPNAAVPALLQKLRAAVASAADAPPRSRGPERVAAARVMLALGMAAEAGALLAQAANDDPAVAADPKTDALAGIAAVLAGRPAEAGGLDNPALPEAAVALWRGLRDAAQGRAAPGLAAALEQAKAYPEPIQRRILPPLAEAAITAGKAIPEGTLGMDGPGLAFARALQKEKAGETEAALQAYDALESGRDTAESVRAAIAATELRLATQRIGPGEAADRLDRQTLRWRGDAREAAARLRAAELRAQAGQWRAALEGLRGTEAAFPDTKPQVAARKAAVFRALLTAEDNPPGPLDLVALAGDFADSLPNGEDGERMSALLADKLAALDLPSRAVPILEKLIQNSASVTARAELALRLAQVHLEAGEPAKAEAALGPLGSATLSEARALLLARARAGRGDVRGAADLLASVNTAPADELRAALLAKAGDWRGSLASLQALAAKTVPHDGQLTPGQQDVVLRLATAAVQAGDGAALRQLSAFESRIAPPRAELFRMLTAPALRGPEDLPRAARELAMSRSLLERLDALRRR